MDISVPASIFRRGERARVLYLASNPEIARINAIWTLWQEPLVVCVWAAVLSSIPVLVVVARMRRRASLELSHPPES